MFCDEYEFRLACYRLTKDTFTRIRRYADKAEARFNERNVRTICSLFLLSEPTQLTVSLAKRVVEERSACSKKPSGVAERIIQHRLRGQRIHQISEALGLSRWRVERTIRLEVWRRKAAGEPVPKYLLPLSTTQTGNPDYAIL